MKIFRPKRDIITEWWKNCVNDMIYILNVLPYIITMIKLRRKRYVEVQVHVYFCSFCMWLFEKQIFVSDRIKCYNAFCTCSKTLKQSNVADPCFNIIIIIFFFLLLLLLLKCFHFKRAIYCRSLTNHLICYFLKIHLLLYLNRLWIGFLEVSLNLHAFMICCGGL